MEKEKVRGKSKNMKEEKLRSNKAITLIALVITIIVLLILAGVTIATLTGENGILTRASDAKEETEKASVIEQAQTDLLAKQAENLSGDVTASDLKEVLDKYFNDVPEADDITADIILTTKDEYGGNYQIAVSDIYNDEIKGAVSIPEGLEIGSTVSYNPSGTYLWESEYCSSPENTSYEKTLNSGEGQEFNINTWKVFDINEETGEITLVPDHSTADLEGGGGGVYLRGAQGYNNAVKLLNDACSNLYGDSSKGITARSIKIEDIEGKMTNIALTEAHSFSDAQAPYGQQIANGYTQSNSYYPSIYAKEALRSLDGENRISSGLGMSEQTSLIESTDDGATNGCLQGTSLRPTQTFWYGDSSFMRTAFETADNGMNYYDLLMPDGENTFYWVASRCVDTYNSDFCRFFVSEVNGGEMGSFNSNDNNSSKMGALFPVVSLSSELIGGDSSSGFVVQ